MKKRKNAKLIYKFRSTQFLIKRIFFVSIKKIPKICLQILIRIFFDKMYILFSKRKVVYLHSFLSFLLFLKF